MNKTKDGWKECKMEGIKGGVVKRKKTQREKKMRKRFNE